MTVREGLQIEISGIPAENGKCRVETQLKIGFHLKDANGADIQRWKQIRLPHKLIAKEKHRMEKYNGRNKDIADSEILTLDAKLVCDHDMTKILETCDNCIGRERKRAHRRKETQKLPGQLASIPIFGAISTKNGASLADEPIQPTPTDPIEYQAWERSRIMVFSNTEYVDLTSGQCQLPTRITCYCRHHNERVGFRIRFTARDSTGSVVASVLTHAVMMMDDHKSGKKASTSGQAKRTNGASKDKAASSKRNSLSNMEQEQEHENDQPEMEDDESQEEQDDEIDLEAGNHIPRQMTRNGSKQLQDPEMTSGDTLSPLGQPDRAGSKRRVNDSALDDFQNKSVDDPMRGPFRRKTSHDVSDRQTHPFFAASTFIPSASTPLPSPSPFVPGSTFAKDEALFPPSFAHATAASSFLDQKYMSLFMNRPQGSLGSSSDKGPGIDAMQVEASSMLESFTTLDESMSSPPNHPPSFLSTGAQKGETTIGRSSDMPTRASFTIPATSQPTFTPFVPTFTPVSNELISAPKMTSSFLDASQIQEFQNFKKQNLLYQQLQKGVDPGQKPIDPKPVPWSKPDSKDPYRNMRTALSQTTSPSSSAFIPIPMTLPEDTGKSSPAMETETEPVSTSGSDAPLQPKKRGRPRKNATPSQATSPVLSAKPSSSPPSPSLLPLNGLSAAQIILLQHRQQQQHQLQQHQQQLQQQQKQAILARQKPRVQKLIPSRGSVEGGTEITLLGSGFYPGMIPTFDGVPALQVQYYGPETMICRLPPRNFPGTVVVKAPGALKGPGLGIVASVKDDPASTDLVKTMAELFGPTSQSNLVGDDDVGVLFEYEESKGDHDLIALALQVLGMKMSGRVEPPHQVAMRIMGTAAASNVLMGQAQQGSGPHGSSSQISLHSQPQPSFLQFTSIAQATGQSMLNSQPRSERPMLNQSQSMPILTNGAMLPNGLMGYNFLTSMSGGNGGH
ncbi:hypothetical protein BGZ52_003038 [Haplosporangium bisporale]|nr:hypothetical protein BGZ52_003038 [Haplosporangium bisporale]KAF9211366.1 hypothetical protein BGZ59_008180 [Podila verticillata]KFH69932.1 hypothetical protein MVEG_04736 [Podila verticillata NRRL 6337]